jgi:hypothetical protein
MATKRYRLSDEDEEQDDDEAFAQVRAPGSRAYIGTDASLKQC